VRPMVDERLLQGHNWLHSSGVLLDFFCDGVMQILVHLMGGERLSICMGSPGKSFRFELLYQSQLLSSHRKCCPSAFMLTITFCGF